MAPTAKKNLWQRMHAVMADADRVSKDGQVKGGGNYKFVSHDAVTTEIRRHLVEHGVVAIPTLKAFDSNGNRVEATFTVRFVNIDDPTDFYEVDSFGFGIDTQDKGPGKAYSYAVKYALLKAFCLPTGDDPERDSIEHKPRAKNTNANGADSGDASKPRSPDAGSGTSDGPAVPAPPKSSGSAPSRGDIIALVKEKGIDTNRVGDFVREKYNVLRVDKLNANQRRELFDIINTGEIPEPHGAVNGNAA